jgi:hypothetical protein
MSNQKQVNEGGNATLSVKVSQETYELLNILAEGLHHGTNANDLLKMFVQAFIESAKHCGPVSQDIQLLLDMLKIEGDWNKAFNFADITKQKRIAQVVLILEQPGREGYGAVLINRPYLPGKKPYMTHCVDDILERVAEVSMKGVYQRLRDIGNEIGTQSLRETLLKLIEDYKKHSTWLQFEEEGPQLGNYSDFGRAIEYGNRAKRKKHLTPDSIQQHIVFGDDDREAADMEVQDWEGEYRNPDNDTPPDDFRPHGEEW